MFKNKIAVVMMSVLLVTSVISQTCLAFPSILDDVPEKEMFTSETTAGTISDVNVKRAIKLLNYIGIISENEEEFEENSIVSRAYAVSAFAAILTGARISGEAASFSDVPTTHENAASIAQAMQYGILDNSANKFYPNKNVSYEDIAIWALKALRFDVSLTAKQPMQAADDLDFFKRVSKTSDGITMAQFMLILENVVNSDLVITHYSKKDNSYTVSDSQSYLSKNHNITIQEGMLTGYKYSSMYGDVDMEDGVVQINRVGYKIDEELSVDKVGYNVCAYIDRNDDKIVSLWMVDSKNEVFEVEREDYLGFDAAQIRTSNKRIRLDDGARVMRNDLFDGYYDLNMAATLSNTDKIVVIDNNRDGSGDLIKVYKYTHYFVKSISAMSKTVAFGNEQGTLDVSENTTTEFVFEGKVIDPLVDLKTNDVLTVLEGVRANGKLVFCAEISRDAAEGTLTDYGTDDFGRYYYTLDNETYYMSDELYSYLNAKSSHRKIGDYITAYIGSDKKIVYIKSEDDFMYGYVMDAKYIEFDDDALITVYTDEGKSKRLNLAEKIIVYNENNQTGLRMNTQAASDEFFSGGAVKNEMIAYTLNSDGEINKLAFAIDRTTYKPGNSSYPLTLDLNYTPTSESDSRARLYRGILGSKYVMNGTTPLYIVPSPTLNQSKNEKLYQMTTGGKWSLEKYFGPSEVIRGYNMDKFYKPAMYVVNGEVTSNISQGDGKVHFYVVDNVKAGYNEEENIIEKLICYYDNTTYKTVAVDENVAISKPGYYCDVTSIDQLKKGDVIQVHINATGKIDVLTVYFRISEHTEKARGMYYYDEENQSGTAAYTADVTSAMPNVGVVYGKVKDSEGNRVIIETVSGQESPVSVAGSIYGNAYFTVYDTQTEDSVPASFAEMQPKDLVLMRKYYNHVQDVIIIR